MASYMELQNACETLGLQNPHALLTTLSDARDMCTKMAHHLREVTGKPSTYAEDVMRLNQQIRQLRRKLR